MHNSVMSTASHGGNAPLGHDGGSEGGRGTPASPAGRLRPPCVRVVRLRSAPLVDAAASLGKRRSAPLAERAPRDVTVAASSIEMDSGPVQRRDSWADPHEIRF